MRSKPFHECTRSEKRSQGYWCCFSRIHRNDPGAQTTLYDLDRRLDTPGYPFDLRALRAAVRRVVGPEVYRRSRSGDGIAYETPVHIYSAPDIEGAHVQFNVKAFFEEVKAPDGYEYVGVFQVGDAYNMQPDMVRDDRLYRHYVWPLRERPPS